MRSLIVAAALSLTLMAGPAFAQTPAPTQPAPAQPAPTKPAPTAQPAPPPQPQVRPAEPSAPRPFPEGAKIGFVVLQRIANDSADGKASTAKLQAFQTKKAAELGEKNKQLQGLQQKLEKEGSVMSASAQGDLQKQVERATTDLQRAQQDAQAELQELQGQLQQQFTQRVEPILAQVGQEKGLHFIFNGPDSGMVWADPGLDITADVIKKLDAAPATAPKPPATKPPGL
jgi:outer membrane protein